MKSLKYSFFLILLCVVSISFSQERREEDNSQTKQVSNIYTYRETVSNYLQISQINSRGNQRNRSVNQNNRNISIIQQVGDANRALTNTVSGLSDIQYLQVGNENTINSFNSTFNATERIIQNGQNNSVSNFSFGTVNNANLNVTQNGNNLKFKKFGTNAQTNGIKFKFSGNNQNVTVRSF